MRPEKTLGCCGSVQSQLLEGEGEGEEAAASARGQRTWLGLGEGRVRPEKAPAAHPTLSVSPEGLTVLQGCHYTHFTDYHGGAEVSDLLKISQLLSDSWDSNACRPVFQSCPSSFALLPTGSCCLLEAAVGSLSGGAGRAGQGSQGGANAGQVGRAAKSRELVTTE